jgi:antitoxin ChpS
MLAVPPAFLDQLHLQVGATVGLALDQGRLVVNPHPRKSRYSLDELLAQCEPNAEMSDEDRQWLTDRSVGGELL